MVRPRLPKVHEERKHKPLGWSHCCKDESSLLQTEITLLHLLAGVERRGFNNRTGGFPELGGKLCSLQECWACDPALVSMSLLLGDSRMWLWMWVMVRAGMVPAFCSGCRVIPLEPGWD